MRRFRHVRWMFEYLMISVSSHRLIFDAKMMWVQHSYKIGLKHIGESGNRASVASRIRDYWFL